MGAAWCQPQAGLGDAVQVSSAEPWGGALQGALGSVFLGQFWVYKKLS